MRVHLHPIVYQPVPAARPVSRVASAPVDAKDVKRVAERQDGGARSHSRRQPDRRRNERPEDGDAPARHPAALLAATLAALDLERLMDRQPIEGHGEGSDSPAANER